MSFVLMYSLDYNKFGPYLFKLYLRDWIFYGLIFYIAFSKGYFLSISIVKSQFPILFRVENNLGYCYRAMI